jgi:hypothetical protein
MRRTRKHNKNLRKTRKGGMNSNQAKKYPPLPESPTNRKEILTNSESLMPPKKESEEYKKRHNRLMKIFNKARERTLMNKILGRKLPEPKLNSNGYPKSFFSVNNNVGFKKF